ncbi:protein-tyrosine-phosphatase [Cellulophaga sp. F20128]|uniref:protein-tyrosine-phosphatase n=1 Tax=Cellulophaga sp. F20128 TaxID=2926413 RepID=UPI001FF3AA9F|nr:protein-tyrosine-phosphatase [Cellulophaga sp. F20128]MCK0157731.1 protein-tyrosine-phosphatase [Cellulophaga sp. F20128]
MTLFSKIEYTILTISGVTIASDRKGILQPLIDFIQEKVNDNQEIRLNFICTHNSRRSHLSQIWAQVMAYYFGIKNVASYSGGTEATALFPKVAKTLVQQGFKVQELSQGKNPIYSIAYSENEHPVIGFSKKYDAAFNPASAFAAILTCSQADGGCPFIVGAEARVPITYEDPKTYDDTPLQAEKYQERSLQIASEMYYVFSKIKIKNESK